MNCARAAHAWVDESMRASGAVGADAIYLLAAAVADPSACQPIRDKLLGLLIGKNDRLHWRYETTKRKRVIAAVIAEFPIVHTVVVGAPLDHTKQERARRMCMETMLLELDRLGVAQVWVETRKASQDARDLKMMDAVRSMGIVSPTMRIDFERPQIEPMLWIADAVAGAVGSARVGDDRLPREILGEAVIEITRRIT